MSTRGAWLNKDSFPAGEESQDLAVEEHVRNSRRNIEDLQQKYGTIKMSEDQVTTLLIKKVPRKHTEETLLQELQPHVEPGSYNFLFMPWDGRRSANLGSAFLNCVDAPTARRLHERLDGKPWLFVEQPREIKVLSAHVQGIARNLVLHLGSSLVQPGYSHPPMAFHNGLRISFERAVDIYCPPDLVREHFRDKSMAQEDVAARPSSHARVAQTPTGSSWSGPAAREARGSLIFEASAEARPAARPPGHSSAGDLVPQELGWQPAVRSANSVRSLLEADGSDSAQVLASDIYITAWKQINGQLRDLEAAPGMGTDVQIHVTRFRC